ncbi:NEL-type E3 ubiquitin ligase domain-containing protein, partial [Brevibacillus sp. SIMBA_040]
DASPDQAQLWDELFEGDSNRHLREVVEGVARSRQAERNLRSLTRQVWQLLEQAGQDEELRTHLDTVAQEYPPTCGDANTDA